MCSASFKDWAVSESRSRSFGRHAKLTSSPMLAELVESLGSRPVLVVADAPDGLRHGAMVNFQLVDQRVRFEISPRNARAARLVLSSRLLSAAIRVETSSCWIDCRPVVPTREPALVAASRASIRQRAEAEPPQLP